MRSREEIERALETITSVWDLSIREGDKEVQHTSQAAMEALQWVLQIPEADRFDQLLFKLDHKFALLWRRLQ